MYFVIGQPGFLHTNLLETQSTEVDVFFPCAMIMCISQFEIGHKFTTSLAHTIFSKNDVSFPKVPSIKSFECNTMPLVLVSGSADCLPQSQFTNGLDRIIYGSGLPQPSDNFKFRVYFWAACTNDIDMACIDTS